MRVFGHGPVDGVGAAINTLESFAECRDGGVDAVELDVRQTAGEQLVVTHDPGSGPSLGAALDACRGITVNVEVKNFPKDPEFDPEQRITHLVLDLLAARGGSDDVLISCFDLAALDVVRQRAPEVPTAALLLSRRPPEEILGPVVDHGHAIVHPYDTMVDEAFMAAARARGLEVNVWLNEPGEERLRALVDLGVDGLITSELSAASRAIRGSARPG